MVKLLKLLKGKGRYDLTVYFVTKRLANMKIVIDWNYIFPGLKKLRYSLTLCKNPPANAGDIRDHVQSVDWEDALEKEMATYSSILAWEIPWTKVLTYSPRGQKELDTTEQLTLSLSLG